MKFVSFGLENKAIAIRSRFDLVQWFFWCFFYRPKTCERAAFFADCIDHRNKIYSHKRSIGLNSFSAVLAKAISKYTRSTAWRPWQLRVFERNLINVVMPNLFRYPTRNVIKIAIKALMMGYWNEFSMTKYFFRTLVRCNPDTLWQSGHLVLCFYTYWKNTSPR